MGQKMKPFTAHPYHQRISYLDHWCFAMGIAFRLLASVLAFAVHAILPFIPIDPQLDLESTAAFLVERNVMRGSRPPRQQLSPDAQVLPLLTENLQFEQLRD
jgi:hypothetical protein